MVTNTRKLIGDDVLVLPVPNGVGGYELVDGSPVPVTPASPLHGELIVEIARRLANHVIEHDLPGRVLSDAGFVLGLERDPERMLAPDIAYVEKSRLAGVDPERLFRGVPDLAIEIDLASGKKPGGQQRVIDYVEAGVRLLWVVDPRSGTAVSYRPDGSARLVRENEALDAGEVVPGFTLPLGDLFG